MTERHTQQWNVEVYCKTVVCNDKNDAYVTKTI